MQELKEKGPIVVSFEPDYNFMMYKSGIYHSIDEKTWISKGLPKPEWEKVDHSVLLVGWGEDEKTGEKFWIVQNTWGPQWGEDGFFRMRRGVDDFGIESICEAADPIIIEQATQKVLDKIELENLVNNGNNNVSRNNSNVYRGLRNENSNGLLNINNNNNANANTNANNNQNGPVSFFNDLSAMGNNGFNLNVQFNNIENLGKNNNDSNNFGRVQQQDGNFDENKSIFDIFK